MVAAIFTTAVFHASICSTTCAVGYCPNQAQQTAGNDCDQTPAHHPDQSKHHTPDDPDCAQRQHPGLFVTKSGDLSQFQVSVAGHPNASVAAFLPVHALVASLARAEASDHAPPLASSLPLYLQISVLRI
jgi:hypothetical protein